MSKKDVIYNMIVERLISAHYRFGTPILVKDLAAETGISRQPIMSALGYLSADGFVRIAPQVGCQVIDPDPRSIADFFLMFAKMEGLLARLAAERRSDDQVQALCAAQADIMALDPQDPSAAERYARRNQRFHVVIQEMADSALVAERQRLNFNMSDFFIAQTVGFDRLLTVAARDHDDIIDAIEARDADRAEQVTFKHIARVADEIRKAESL